MTKGAVQTACALCSQTEKATLMFLSVAFLAEP